MPFFVLVLRGKPLVLLYHDKLSLVHITGINRTESHSSMAQAHMLAGSLQFFWHTAGYLAKEQLLFSGCKRNLVVELMELIVNNVCRSGTSWHPNCLCSCSIRWSKLSTGRSSWLLHSGSVCRCNTSLATETETWQKWTFWSIFYIL